MDKETIRIGFVQRSHGIQGALKVQPLTDDSTRFKRLKRVFVEQKNTLQSYDVVSAEIRQDVIYLKLAGLDTRDAAERLHGAYICVPRAEAVSLPKDAYFICDLIGCRVTDTAGRDWGILQDVLQTGAADVYVVRGEGEMLLPALKKALKDVDVTRKHILLDAEALKEVALLP